MYYLLETNYIISENEIKEKGFEIVDNAIGKWEKSDVIPWMKEKLNIYTFIKKQSDNVFDLIEVGDLIECANYHFTYVKEKAKTYDNHLIFMNNFSTIYDKHILAIYKPNSNGDYIKVWEKESE